MADLKNRIYTSEMMDDLQLGAEVIEPVLKGLGKVNALLGGHKAIIKAIRKFKLTDGDRISDWGCGGGDALRAIADWAVSQKKYYKLTGIDAAPAAIRFAKQESATYNNINFLQKNVLDDEIAEYSCEIVFTSLFTHHFDDDDWVVLVKNMYRSAIKGVIITDLHRHWLAYYGVIAITRLFTRDKMARNDGPLSVRKAFTRKDLVNLLKAAQIENYKLTWAWAFRWRILIYKP